MSLTTTAIKGVTWTSISTIIRSIVQLFQVAILTRYVDKSDFGLIAISTLFLGFTQIFLDLGISAGILHKKDISIQQYSTLFWLNIILGIFLTSILSGLSFIIAQFYKEPELTKIIIILSLTVFFSSIGNLHRTVQQKKMRFKEISIIEIIASILTFILATTMAVNNFGVYSLVFSSLFHVASINIFFLMIGIYKDKNIMMHFCIKEVYSFFKIGIFSVGSQILDYISREIDIIIISSTLSKEYIGLYSLCKKIIHTLYNAINPILIKVLTPLLANIQQEKERVRIVYYKIIESLAFVNYPIYILIAIFSHGILNFLYGTQYTDGSIPLTLLALLYGFNSTSNPVGSLQIAMGYTNLGFYWTIIRIFTNTIGILIGCIHGINGLVLSLFIVTIIVDPLFWRITIYNIIGGHYIEYLKKTLYIFVRSCIIAIPFYYVSYNLKSVLICLILGLVYLIIYVIFVKTKYSQSYLVKQIITGINTKLSL